MKFLLRLSLATLLVASSLAASNTPPSPLKATGNPVQDFIDDPQIQAIAPHLVQLLLPSSASYPYNQGGTPLSSSLIADTKIPLLNDIIEIVSMTIFNAKTADWSRLEAAKLQAIQQHGEEAVNMSGDLNAMDMHRAAVIVKTIYDTVIHIPATNKETYAARAEDSRTKKSGGSFWDFLGFGLVKSSEAVQGVKSLVSPESYGCETDDVAYLRGVDEVVYYSSLTDGLAGGTLAAAPANSAVKSLGLGTIIASVGKLAIELHMAQAVARLADLNPADDAVRAMIYLTLQASSAHDESAQTARDLFNINRRNLLSRVPFGALKSLEDASALALMTQGAGQGGSGGPRLFSKIPVLRNLFAFSSDVLSANSLGEVVKFVFCPETDALKQPIVGSGAGQQRVQHDEQEEKEQGQGQDHEQKVLKISKRALRREEAIKNAKLLAKQRAESAQDKEL
ncbi:hypothetical protein EC957_002003 [Mortierella hygrophila]|uniref:Uncharacterized protein n=1 Tax=Mortierella hygrophila TaxID=979708 RepID=A0A9P6K7F8_9FUNG|nr:hypothetical protein EC957_002003 [Mortierella hygrophila]